MHLGKECVWINTCLMHKMLKGLRQNKTVGKNLNWDDYIDKVNLIIDSSVCLIYLQLNTKVNILYSGG